MGGRSKRNTPADSSQNQASGKGKKIGQSASGKPSKPKKPPTKKERVAKVEAQAKRKMGETIIKDGFGTGGKTGKTRAYITPGAAKRIASGTREGIDAIKTKYGTIFKLKKDNLRKGTKSLQEFSGF